VIGYVLVLLLKLLLLLLLLMLLIHVVGVRCCCCVVIIVGIVIVGMISELLLLLLLLLRLYDDQIVVVIVIASSNCCCCCRCYRITGSCCHLLLTGIGYHGGHYVGRRQYNRYVIIFTLFATALAIGMIPTDSNTLINHLDLVICLENVA